MRALLEAAVRRVGERSEEPFAARFADGREYRNRAGEPAFVLAFRTPRAQWRTCAFGHIGMLESYFGGELDIEGDFARALDARRFDERFRRVWRTYLYGCAEMFRSHAGRTHLFQVVFSRGNVTHRSYPMSRTFVYAERPSAGREPAPRPRQAAS